MPAFPVEFFGTLVRSMTLTSQQYFATRFQRIFGFALAYLQGRDYGDD